MKRLSVAYPALLIVGGIVLIQYHAVAFWSEAVGPATGWAWSILLELIALWLWYQPKTRLLAFMATALVLSGPLYGVTAPIAKQYSLTASQKASEPERVALLREAIASERRALQTFLTNSQQRSGWLPAIQRARAELSERRAELNSLLTPRRQPLPIQQATIMVLQAVALTLVQISNVLAITTIADSQRETPKGKARKQKGQRKEARASARSTATRNPKVAQVQTALRRHLEGEGISARAFANRHGFTPRDISLVFHDQENRTAGKRTAPEKVFDQLSTLLLEEAA